MRTSTDDTMLWSDIVKRLEAGESQTEIAAKLKMTRGQFRYRLRKFKEQHAAMEIQEMNIAGSLQDESWTRVWKTNRLVLLVKEPTSVFAYWEVDEARKNLICQHFQSDWTKLPFYLQLYDVSDIEFDGYNAHSVRQIPVHPQADNWYIEGVHPRRMYLMDFGTTTLQGQFFTILRSNVVETPPKPAYRQNEPYVSFAPLHTLRSNEVAATTAAMTYEDALTAASHSKEPAAKAPSQTIQASRASHPPSSSHASQPSHPYEDGFDGYSAVQEKRGGRG